MWMIKTIFPMSLNNNRLKKIRARYILTNDTGPFIENASLLIDKTSGKILSIDKEHGSACKDLLIIPGFINTHTHTDLTIEVKNDTPRIFSEWVLSLIELRKAAGKKNTAILRKKAFRELTAGGTTSICDIISLENLNDALSSASINQDGMQYISQGGLNGALVSTHIPRIKGFIEIRGLDPSLSDIKIEEFEKAQNFLLKLKTAPYGGFSFGISAHSVYSVSKELFKKIVKKNKKWRLDITIHASESEAETQFISQGTGDISENLLTNLNLRKFSKPFETFRSPIAYLDSLGILTPRTSIIHANYIASKDIEIIKRSGVSVIHCPRSNAFFKSRVLPLRKLLDNGINVSLGTDSLYSNSSLSMLDELKYAKKIHRNVTARELFHIATVNGAKVLNMPPVTATLKKGALADIVIFRIPRGLMLCENNIYDNILSFDNNDILQVLTGGKEF